MIRPTTASLLLIALLVSACTSSPPPPAASEYPDRILLPLFAKRSVRDGVLYVTLYASPAFARARDPDVAITHFAIAPASGLEVEFGERDARQLPNRYGWAGTYALTVNGKSLGIDIEVDGQAHTLSVADSRFSLPDGNCIRITVSPELLVTATQLDAVLVRNPGNFDRVFGTFNADAATP